SKNCSGVPPASHAVGVGQPASFAMFGNSVLSMPADPRASLASGVGHPVRPVADVRGADARRRERDTPIGVVQRFHVSLYKVDPLFRAAARAAAA
ncbi:hypothetical protein, partial [Burkholderia cenocepacia]|uniref:hypothetical protein n=1 Tax=Burkholderia cenocepacia TaxID=95486 RepID=UPI002232394A